MTPEEKLYFAAAGLAVLVLLWMLAQVVIQVTT